VLHNDTDAEDDPLTIIILESMNVNGTAIVDDNSTPLDPTDDMVKFTPKADHTGEASFAYKVSDGELESNQATVSVNVIKPRSTWQSQITWV
jgi:hypothetical protein